MSIHLNSEYGALITSTLGSVTLIEVLHQTTAADIVKLVTVLAQLSVVVVNSYVALRVRRRNRQKTNTLARQKKEIEND
jgi:hypothetical protein